MKTKDFIKYFIVCPFVAIAIGMLVFGCASINNSMIKTCLDSGGSVEYRTVTGNWMDSPAESFKCTMKRKSAKSARKAK